MKSVQYYEQLSAKIERDHKMWCEEADAHHKNVMSKYDDIEKRLTAAGNDTVQIGNLLNELLEVHDEASKKDRELISRIPRYTF